MAVKLKSSVPVFLGSSSYYIVWCKTNFQNFLSVSSTLETSGTVFPCANLPACKQRICMKPANPDNGMISIKWDKITSQKKTDKKRQNKKLNVSITYNKEGYSVYKNYKIIIIFCEKIKLTLTIIKKATNHRNVFKSVTKCDIFPTLFSCQK